MAKRKRNQQERGEPAGSPAKKSRPSSDSIQENGPSSNGLAASKSGQDHATDTGEKRAEEGARQKAEQRLSAKPTSTTNGRKKSKSSLATKKTFANWQISPSLGGALSDVRPILTTDQQSLLLSYQSCVKVYDLSSSSLSRVLKPASRGSISGVVLSPLHPSTLYISLSFGGVEEWDWTSATRKRAWNISSSIFAIAAGTLSETLYTVDTDSARKRWRITGHRLRESADTELQTLYRSPTPLTNLQILQDGHIVASANQKILLGSLKSSSLIPLKDQVYAWYEFDCTEAVTCLDARIQPTLIADGSRISEEAEKTKKIPKLSKPSKPPAERASKALNLVVGGILGTIFVYEDILNSLSLAARSKSTPIPRPRQLHWHQKLVGDVKWSSDGENLDEARKLAKSLGNYIISGGFETVVVFWQLDTGRFSFLPHLSAAIENICVSSDGSSYGISLANNSALVLSALNLEPVASVIGIQLPISGIHNRSIQDVPRLAARGLPKLSRRPAATVSPTAPGLLLLTVPASSISRLESYTSQGHTYLQTFDIMGEKSVARQALTRTLLTDLPSGPEGNTIIEPDVVLLRVSSCGTWLATVDEWRPPERDLRASTVDSKSAERSAAARTEVHLKFWLASTDRQEWELVSRIDAPHLNLPGEVPTAGRILDLAEDFSSIGFATFGDDGMVKIWRPQTRYRDGLVVRGKNAEAAMAWVCQHAISSPLPSPIADQHASDIGRLAFSIDGSLLCVAQQNSQGSLVFSIDPANGQVHSLLPNLIQGDLISLGVVERYMVVLSDGLVVWDLVENIADETFATSFGDSRKDRYSHLAIDQKHGTFAIGTVSPLQKSATVRIFEAKHRRMLYSTGLPRPLRLLVCNCPRRDYIVVDDMAKACIIGPTINLPAAPRTAPLKLPDRSAGLEKILEEARHAVAVQNVDLKEQKYLQEPESTVVRPHQLAQIFEVAPPSALPPMTRLFEQVATLFSPKVATV